MFIDVHAHLNDKKFENIDEIITNAEQAGVEKIITAGYDITSSIEGLEIANKHTGVFATVGIHPENTDDVEENYLDKLKELCKDKKVVAIGEIGLDYHFRSDNKDLQKKILIEQIALANELNLPVVLHCRDAIGDMMTLLQEHRLKRESLLHCYSGSIESAREFMKLGFSFSFGGVVTFKNASNVINVISNLPLEKIMIETDCPYMAPVPFRGKMNEPKFIPYIAEKIAEIKSLSVEEIAEKTTKNAEKMFKI